MTPTPFVRWPADQPLPPLAADAVHVWCSSLTRPSADIRTMASHLSPDEQARAAKFHFDHHRQQYLYGRGLLRTLIGHYQQISPQAVTFTYGPQGKPALADADLRFNLSHAGGLALLAFTRNREIGVDIEQIRPLADAAHMARRFFAPAEVATYTAVAEPHKPQAFFNCWTRKEAYIKAIGEGLSCPLHSFEVSLQPGQPAALLQIGGSATAAAAWTLHSLDPAPGYVGAVIAHGNDWQLHQWQWP